MFGNAAMFSSPNSSRQSSADRSQGTASSGPSGLLSPDAVNAFTLLDTELAGVEGGRSKKKKKSKKDKKDKREKKAKKKAKAVAAGGAGAGQPPPMMSPSAELAEYWQQADQRGTEGARLGGVSDSRSTAKAGRRSRGAPAPATEPAAVPQEEAEEEARRGDASPSSSVSSSSSRSRKSDPIHIEDSNFGDDPAAAAEPEAADDRGTDDPMAAQLGLSSPAAAPATVAAVEAAKKAASPAGYTVSMDRQPRQRRSIKSSGARHSGGAPRSGLAKFGPTEAERITAEAEAKSEGSASDFFVSQIKGKNPEPAKAALSAKSKLVASTAAVIASNQLDLHTDDFKAWCAWLEVDPKSDSSGIVAFARQASKTELPRGWKRNGQVYVGPDGKEQSEHPLVPMLRASVARLRTQLSSSQRTAPRPSASEVSPGSTSTSDAATPAQVTRAAVKQVARSSPPRAAAAKPVVAVQRAQPVRQASPVRQAQPQAAAQQQRLPEQGAPAGWLDQERAHLDRQSASLVKEREMTMGALQSELLRLQSSREVQITEHERLVSQMLGERKQMADEQEQLRQKTAASTAEAQAAGHRHTQAAVELQSARSQLEYEQRKLREEQGQFEREWVNFEGLKQAIVDDKKAFDLAQAQLLALGRQVAAQSEELAEARAEARQLHADGSKKLAQAQALQKRLASQASANDSGKQRLLAAQMALSQDRLRLADEQHTVMRRQQQADSELEQIRANRVTATATAQPAAAAPGEGSPATTRVAWMSTNVSASPSGGGAKRRPVEHWDAERARIAQVMQEQADFLKAASSFSTESLFEATSDSPQLRPADVPPSSSSPGLGAGKENSRGFGEQPQQQPAETSAAAEVPSLALSRALSFEETSANASTRSDASGHTDASFVPLLAVDRTTMSSTSFGAQ